MRSIRDGTHWQLRDDIVMYSRDRPYSAGTRIKVEHYALEVTDGYVRHDAILIRVVAPDGQVIHVLRDELDVIEQKEAAE